MRPFTDKQIELVTTFADQAVIAIENVRLFDEVQARTAISRSRCSSRLPPPTCFRSSALSTGELEPVFETIVGQCACELCEADNGVIWLRKGGRIPSAALRGPWEGDSSSDGVEARC